MSMRDEPVVMIRSLMTLMGCSVDFGSVRAHCNLRRTRHLGRRHFKCVGLTRMCWRTSSETLQV